MDEQPQLRIEDNHTYLENPRLLIDFNRVGPARYCTRLANRCASFDNEIILEIFKNDKSERYSCKSVIGLLCGLSYIFSEKLKFRVGVSGTDEEARDIALELNSYLASRDNL